MSERVNPYTALKQTCAKWASEVLHPRRRAMWSYPKEKLNAGWHLTDLYERVAAAKQLGWRVELEAEGDGLRVVYIKDPPDAPWEIRP